MKSIDKLRESSHLDDNKWTLETGEVVNVFGSEPSDPNAVNWGKQWRKIADEIEAEIAERYMELPVDRKNEPWHIGDKFSFADAGGNKHICTVSGISVSEVFFYYDEHHDSTKHRHFKADVLAHVKPRTLEDVLVDMLEDAVGYSDAHTDVSLVAVEKYADEIRELLLGGDAE